MSLPLKSWCEIEKRGGVGEGLGGGHPIIPIWHAGMTAMSKPPLLPSVASRAPDQAPPALCHTGCHPPLQPVLPHWRGLPSA